MSFLSKLTVAASNFDFEVKKLFRTMIGTEIVAGTGTTIADAAAITTGRTMLTVADGTVGWILPKGEKDMALELVNTVSNQTAKIYPASASEQINAITAGSPFSLLGGSRGVFHCDANGHWYVAAANLTGTSTSSTTAELDTLHNVTAGTNAASSALVTNSVKSVDVLQATTALTVGGTGVPGAASADTTVTKAVTAFTNTVAKAVFTVTVPNAAHAALIDLDLLGVLGAGGSIGAGESCLNSKYCVTLARTAGVNVVPAVTAVTGGGAASTVAGGQAVSSVVATLSTITGGVTASNTFTINVAITRAGSGADNHTLLAVARVANQNATGVTIA